MSDAAADTRVWEKLSLRGWVLLMGALALAAAGWASYHTSPKSVKARREEPSPTLPTRLAPQELTEAEADREAAPVAGYRRDVVRPRPVQKRCGDRRTQG